MSNRAARRAAAHQSSKNVSEAQLAANRANCQSSTGPKSEQGKLVSSHNALKTGLTGRTIVLPTDDVAAYQTLVALINKKFTPVNDIEQHLVQTIADIEWRLLRIPTLESGFYALGRHRRTPPPASGTPRGGNRRRNRSQTRFYAKWLQIFNSTSSAAPRTGSYSRTGPTRPH